MNNGEAETSPGEGFGLGGPVPPLTLVPPPGADALVAACHRIFHDTDLEPLFAGLDGSPFQSQPVLSCWLATFSGRGDASECYLITLANREGDVVLALPITRRKAGGLTRIELPHSGVIDFTSPFIRLSHAASLPSPAVLWCRIRSVIPPADLVIFRRLAPGSEAFPNPLFSLPASLSSRLISLRVVPLRSHEARHEQLAKSFRKKLRHNIRKFFDIPGAGFIVARTPEEALSILSWMETTQGERIRSKGLAYGLDCPRVKDFYRRLIASGIENGTTLMVAMRVGESIVAATFSILSRGELVFLRVASDLSEHGALSPGLLVTDATMGEAFVRGITRFDFGMGDYRYKRQLGGSAVPLRDIITPLSLKGILPALLMRVRQKATQSPRLRRIFGREPLAQA